MKYILLTALLIVSAATKGQLNKTYAITGTTNNPTYWADIKQIDIATGKIVKTIYQANNNIYKLFSDPEQSLLMKQNMVPAGAGLGIAACALDVVNNRLYFAPLHFSNISYLDLNEEALNFTTIKSNLLNQPDGSVYSTEENQFTRMAFAPDGYGYTLSNDANHLIRFSTAKNAVIEDLGAVLDNDNNKEISIHNKCTGWGGGMVADAFGKLVVVTAMHQIFIIDVNSKIATHAGNISGLPNNFSTNAAAVDADGWLVVGCANTLAPLYKVDLKNRNAISMDSATTYFNTADMANGNLLLQKEFDAVNKFSTDKLESAGPVLNGVKVYPNPITGASFYLKLTNQQAGNYTLVLTDIAGRIMYSKPVQIIKANQTVSITLLRKPTGGTYFVKVISAANKTTLKDKVVIE